MIVEQIYTAGKIISNHWGYDQTNIDFYKITKRKGNFVTLEPLKSIEKSDGALTMTGTTIPGAPKPAGKIIRRKVHTRDGKESGIAVESYGWASLWDGQPEHYSSYG